jgi:PAS domain S-box-containing protein
MVQSADDAIIGKTIRGIVQTWNPGAERLYGYSSEDMVGRDMMILLPPDRSDEEAFMFIKWTAEAFSRNRLGPFVILFRNTGQGIAERVQTSGASLHLPS